MNHLDLLNSYNQRKQKTESALRAVSEKMFEEETVLTALMPKIPIALSAVSIDWKVFQWGIITTAERIEFVITLPMA